MSPSVRDVCVSQREGSFEPWLLASGVHAGFLTAYPEFLTVLSATLFGEAATFNFMVVYSLFTFGKRVRIVPEVVGRQQTPNSCGFDIHTHTYKTRT